MTRDTSHTLRAIHRSCPAHLGSRPIRPALSLPQVLAFRLHRLHLDRRSPRHQLRDVVRALCGVQAQLMSAATIALWARIDGLTLDDVETAMWRKRTIIKTWCMRGTVHLLPAIDTALYLTAMARRCSLAKDRWARTHKVSSFDAQAAVDAVLLTLEQGPLTRKEISARLVTILNRRPKQWTDLGWGRSTKNTLPPRAWLMGSVCFGPNKGRESTLVRLDQWLPNLRGVSQDTAEETILEKYLQSYGPATLQDFAHWSGFAANGLEQTMRRLGNKVANVTINGKQALLLRRDLDELMATPPLPTSVHLLPNFDPYVLAHCCKQDIMNQAYSREVYRPGAWIAAVVLLNGRVIGTWAYERRGQYIRVVVKLFEKTSRRHLERIEAEGRRLACFLGGQPEVSFVGP